MVQYLYKHRAIHINKYIKQSKYHSSISNAYRTIFSYLIRVNIMILFTVILKLHQYERVLTVQYFLLLYTIRVYCIYTVI